MAFSGGQSLYSAVREARERLQGLESQFPCASWLPTLWQNPAFVPPTWETLRGVKPENSAQTQRKKNGFNSHKNLNWLGFVLVGVGIISWQFISVGLAIIVNDISFDYYNKGQKVEAKQALELATWLNPNNAAVFYNWGWRWEQVLDFQSARENYTRAAALDLGAAYSELARLNIIIDKNYSGAVHLAQEGLALDELDDLVKYSLYKNLGWARLEQGRYEEADEALLSAIRLKNSRASAHCLRAQLGERQGNKVMAMNHWKICYQEGISKNSNRPMPEEDQWFDMARQRLESVREKQ